MRRRDRKNSTKKYDRKKPQTKRKIWKHKKKDKIELPKAKLAALLYSKFFLYCAQSNDPSFHSWNRPTIKITKNKNAPTTVFNLSILDILTRTGNNKTISTSKIKKIIASKKNRKEKGKRADLIGSKPHSKGELFSRSLIVRLAKIQPRVITTEDKITATTLLIKLLNI